MSEKAKTLKWSARIFGGIAILIFIAFLFRGSLSELMNSYSGDQTSMMFLIGFAILGYLFAWFREKEGGLVLIISGVIIGLNLFYNGGMKGFDFILIYSLPAIITGVLFLFEEKLSKP